MTNVAPIKPPSLEEDILEAAGLEAEDLVDLPGRHRKLDWAGSAPWEKGKPVPGNDSLTVYGIFASGSTEARPEHTEHALGDVRIYATPRQSLPGDNYCRYVFNRTTPAGLSENLTKLAFVTEVARELSALIEIDAGTEVIDCPNCGEENPDSNRFCGQCAIELPESDEEPEIEEAGKTDPAPAPELELPNG